MNTDPTNWEGWRPVGDVPSVGADQAPEPLAPQGAYNLAMPEEPLELPAVEGDASVPRAELLAPAGGLEAAFAALHYGADAVYLGLKRFSARAEAENFSLEEVDEITAYAHSMTPPRRIFVTVNTVIRQDELEELVDCLAALSAIGVDAIILQDLGVYRLIRDHFANISPHGSTQMSVHNRAGAQTLSRLGFSRVVLARELTFEEVRSITSTAGIETEVFIHGALCYSYSGLCLFSAQTLGRSGNRGRCAYSCRDSFEVEGAPQTLRDGTTVKRDPSHGLPFSMKDLALPDHVPALKAAGVSCFKIEGRKKSPLYVATTTDYYRQLIDGTLDPAVREQRETDLKTVFSRPWTRLFMQSHKDKEVADRDTTHHRGAEIGQVEEIRTKSRPHILCFRTRRDLEVRDGIQIDLPGHEKPFGFSLEKLWVLGSRGERRQAFVAAAGDNIEVTLPDGHPHVPLGAPVYCSSSNEVKNRYRYERPRPGEWRGRLPLDLRVTVGETRVEMVARCRPPGGGEPVEVVRCFEGSFAPAKDAAKMAQTARDTLSRLGESRFALGALEWVDPEGRFVPASKLNQTRRELVEAIEPLLEEARSHWIRGLVTEVTPRSAVPAEVPAQDPRWSIKVDRIGFLGALEDRDWEGVEEVVIDVTRDHPAILREKLQGLGEKLGRDRIRLSLPALTRQWEEAAVVKKIRDLKAAGWTRWEASNLSAWDYLGIDPARPAESGLDLTTDWSVYVVNRLAALQVLEMGARRFVLSPEDGRENWRSLLAEFPDHAVAVVYQDTPLFLAESCAYANLIGGCPGKANCRFESMQMESVHGEKVTALDYHCRTIVLNQSPFCLSDRLEDLKSLGVRRLRADFIYRLYPDDEVRETFRRIRQGRPHPRGQAASWDRGML